MPGVFTEPMAVCVMLRILWRGSLLPLECVALTKTGNGCQIFGAATQPSVSKLPRHKSRYIETPD
ncbi:hypothetical protein C1X69_29825 [Pseudomonas sp. FW305-67]|nr:hypothetical protein C1X70_29585 [Pseudomonas sp. FW305-53]PMY86749.1 hypothetical protein C1X68_11725 [Pseudomonas sp. FW303-C2]PMY89331.1 hypothetical protein C1X67_29615 [Pseudomonas sp. FW305-62]PNA80405.1 hypothetical protein C1X66_29760 [Pseudomonas sp. MPR-R3B]PNB09280.1 hypothetical protein C1X69_29825 [Pseudomonas sp. FW305-67]